LITNMHDLTIEICPSFDSEVLGGQIRTFPKQLEQGAGCKLTLTKNAQGKLTAVNVHVDGCELADPNAWKTKDNPSKRKKLAVDNSPHPPLFAFEYNAASTFDETGQVEKALKDYERKLAAWLCSWQVKSKVSREAKMVCRSLQQQLVKAMEDMSAKSEEFKNLVATMSKVVCDQLAKRKQARMVISQRAQKKQKRIEKSAAKQEHGEEEVGAAKAAAQAMGELKGLENMGPTEALKSILDKFGPMTVLELSQVYARVTGIGFKKIVGASVNHTLRENPSLFKLGLGKKWSLLK